jgi:hypothetical protein
MEQVLEATWRSETRPRGVTACVSICVDTITRALRSSGRRAPAEDRGAKMRYVVTASKIQAAMWIRYNQVVEVGPTAVLVLVCI